jgi:hypothetical protein
MTIEVENKQLAALRKALSYPLIDSLTNRRSRRFCLGGTMPGGGLAYKSTQKPMPLSKLEESMLAFAAAGINGFCLGDVPYDEGDQHEAGGGNVMAAITGRVGASADAVHSTALFVINDESTSLLRRPQDFSLEDVNRLGKMAVDKRFEELYDQMRVPIREGRTTIEKEIPNVFPFNKWSTNLAGSTYFLPVSDLSSMYINVILSMFDEQMGMFIVDERNDFKPAGIKRFGRSQGGRLHDAEEDERIIPIFGLETVIVEFMLAEQAFMAHNLSLTEQAMGLGGWTHFATASAVGWFEALGFRLGSQSVSQILNAGFLKRLFIKLLGQDRSFPFPLGLNVDGADLLKPYCPPYYKNMEEAVLAFLKFKNDNVTNAEIAASFNPAWKNPKEIQEKIPKLSDECIAATISYCSYIFDTYGRFPAYFGPYRMTLAHQAHHLELDFYDKFYKPGAYTATQASHMEDWH